MPVQGQPGFPPGGNGTTNGGPGSDAPVSFFAPVGGGSGPIVLGPDGQPLRKRRRRRRRGRGGRQREWRSQEGSGEAAAAVVRPPTSAARSGGQRRAAVPANGGGDGSGDPTASEACRSDDPGRARPRCARRRRD
jgi:hypothetical protein